MGGDAAAMAGCAMLADKYRLPGSQSRRAAEHWDRAGHAGQRALHMGRHVVGAFSVMPPGGGFRRQPVQRVDEIGADVGIGVFLDHERGGGVAQEQGQETLAHAAFTDEIPDVAGDVSETAGLRFDDDLADVLTHACSPMTNANSPKPERKARSTPFFASVSAPRLDPDAEADALGWADDAAAGSAALSPQAGEAALAAFEAARDGRPVHLSDPLFESLWLEGLYLNAGREAPDMRDWMLALAPFGQARDLAAILRAAAPRAPSEEGPDARAARMLEAYREAKKRSEKR